MSTYWIFSIPVFFWCVAWWMRKRNPPPVARTGTPFRTWHETPPWQRLPRIACYLGIALSVVCWSILVLLQGQATAQPSVATGLFQYPYYVKGHVRFLTETQARFEHADIGFAAGWLLGAIGGLSGVWLERRAARTRVIASSRTDEL